MLNEFPVDRNVDYFVFSGSKRMKIGWRSEDKLILERKIMSNLGKILQDKDNGMKTKIRTVKAACFVFLQSCGVERWTIRK